MKTTTYSRDELVAELASVAQRLGEHSVSRRIWLRETGITSWQVYRHFDSWNEFVVAAGLVADDRSRASDDELLAALRDAFVQAGSVTTKHRVRKFCRYGGDVYTKHFGSWPQVLGRLRGWAEENDPDFAYLDDLPQDGSAADRGASREGAVQAMPSWESSTDTQYGPLLNFRGLQHAPINEQGVVFLFGMVARDLGFIVEGVRASYPDCDAKRTVSKTGHLARVRIEFEFRSRNFSDHGHDPAGCDLIVCWENNWPECPVEVLELRSEIERLFRDESA
ncbi:MAG TPA: hypothetical protein VNV42_08495 [Solirubrobacteraceae bacterium]|nr:hypothetical protein [Solirubrobacteraceae bacterium]